MSQQGPEKNRYKQESFTFVISAKISSEPALSLQNFDPKRLLRYKFGAGKNTTHCDAGINDAQGIES
jgi:hypothetical protein